MPAFAHARNCIGGLKEQDMYGVGVEFSFNNNKRFTTWMGAVMTCITMTLFMTFFGIISDLIVVSFKWIEYFSESDSIEYFSEQHQDMEERIDFKSIGFSFAIDNLEPRFGKIEVT